MPAETSPKDVRLLKCLSAFMWYSFWLLKHVLNMIVITHLRHTKKLSSPSSKYTSVDECALSCRRAVSDLGKYIGTSETDLTIQEYHMTHARLEMGSNIIYHEDNLSSPFGRKSVLKRFQLGWDSHHNLKILYPYMLFSDWVVSKKSMWLNQSEQHLNFCMLFITAPRCL